MIIKLYEEKYRDDLIFMVLQAKDALGRKPTINKDLLDIRENYFGRGDMFWVAINEDDRVIGCIGYSKKENHGYESENVGIDFDTDELNFGFHYIF